jgi:hypothetical protein
MALIEIPNAYTSDMAVSTGRECFAVVGEPIVAADLIDTIAAGLFDDLCGRQPLAFMVRVQRWRQPGARRPALSSRGPGLTGAHAR